MSSVRVERTTVEAAIEPAEHPVGPANVPRAIRWVTRRAAREHAPRHIVPLLFLEDFMHFSVALLLIGIAAAVMWRTIDELAAGHRAFWLSVPSAINNVLFVVIILEIFRTILAHFHDGGFQLKPFLIIGIISAVRHVLTVGAQLSLQGEIRNSDWSRSLIELGTTAGVVVALVIALVLVKRSDEPRHPYRYPPQPES